MRARAASGALALYLVCVGGGWARADEAAAVYHAYWAGLPAGDIRLTLRDDPSGYHNQIVIRTEGMPRWLTRFRATASSEGRAAPGSLPQPARYEAVYDLRKAKDRRLSMRFVAGSGGLAVERGPGDTSKKPPLAENFRRNVVDPLSAMTAIRGELRRGNRGAFTVPVYDGARRFDVRVQVLPKHGSEPGLPLELTLAPVAGFKGETSEDGDPDDAPRPVELTLSDDGRLMPLKMSVSVAFMPLVVELAHWCGASQPCEF